MLKNTACIGEEIYVEIFNDEEFLFEKNCRKKGNERGRCLLSPFHTNLEAVLRNTSCLKIVYMLWIRHSGSAIFQIQSRPSPMIGQLA